MKKGTIRKHAFYKYPGNTTGTNRAEAEIEFHRKFTVGPSARPRTMPLKSGGGKQPPGAPSVPSSFSARRSTNKELVSATHGMPRPCLLLLPRPPPHLPRFAHGLRATASSSRVRTRMQNLDDVEISASAVAGDLRNSTGEARISTSGDRNSPFRLQGKASSMSSMSPVSPNIEPGTLGLGLEDSNEVVGYEQRSCAKTVCGIGPRTQNSQGEGEPEE